jgi:transcriptional regulator with XRE-family HTH domain
MPNPLAEFRKRQNPPMTPAALARELEISRSFLLRLESGERKAGTQLLHRIKDRCGIAPSEMRPDLAANAALFMEAAE